MTAQAVRRTWPHLALAFVAMGVWAMLANRHHPWPQIVQAGLVQGMLSACLTLLMKRVVEAVVASMKRRGAPLVALAACGLISICVLSVLHTIAGTPEIIATITVPVVVSSAYAASYAVALMRTAQRKPT